MKESNLDQNIREKLRGREMQPSESAWERLASQLDAVQEKKKKGWWMYVGYAASIALLVSLFLWFNKEEINTQSLPENKLVEEQIKTPKTDRSKEVIHSIPLENDAIVEHTPKEEIKNIKQNENQDRVQYDKKKPASTFQPVKESSAVATLKETESPAIFTEQKTKEFAKDTETIVAVTEESQENKMRIHDVTQGISVNSEALLKSVTSTREELRAYYKKYKIDREEVLIAIEKELKKSNLKIDPKTILAEVELDINEESFQNNFYQFIKKRVSNVATAIANRNN